MFYIGSRNRILRTLPYISKGRSIKWSRRSLWTKIKDFVCGNTLEPQWPQTTVWHEVADRDNIKMHLKNIASEFNSTNVILYGEIVGPGIQDLTYGLDTPKFYAYDIKVNDRFLAPRDFLETCKKLNISCVPLLFVGPFSEKMVNTFKSGKDTISNTHVREGIVIEPESPRYDVKLGRVILKVVSEKYLMRKGGTDFYE